MNSDEIEKLFALEKGYLSEEESIDFSPVTLKLQKRRIK